MEENFMKKLSALMGIAALVLAGTLSYGGDKGKSESWSGWITDETCGAKNANAEGKGCALKCHEAGAKLVLYVDGQKKLVGLDNQDEAARHVGHPVIVTGTIEDGTIKVMSIEEKKS